MNCDFFIIIHSKCLLSLLRICPRRITLRENFWPCFLHLMKILKNRKKRLWILCKNNIKNWNILEKNWLLSFQKNRAYQNLLKWSMKYQSIFHHNSIFLKSLHPLAKFMIRLVWTAELKYQNSSLDQKFKILLMRSKIIIWKSSPPLTWMFQISLQINPLHLLNI